VIKGSWWQCSAYNDTTDNDKMQISERLTYVIQDERLDLIVTFFSRNRLRAAADHSLRNAGIVVIVVATEPKVSGFKPG
jgi:hypothetical protein